MNYKRLLQFFGLTYMISWTVWLPLYLPAFGIHGFPQLPYHHALGAFGPLIAGIVFSYKDGDDSFRNLLSRMFNPKGRILCIITATFAPFLILVIALFIHSFLSGSPFSIKSIGTSREFPEFGLTAFFIYNLFTFGYGEETGWRGYALPILQKKNSPFTASLILTLGWAIWHWPLFLYREGYTEMGLGGIFGWLMSLATGSLLLTWMYNRSKSVLVCAIFHATIDIVFTSNVSDSSVMNTVGIIVTIWGLTSLLTFQKDFFTRYYIDQKQ
jgi:membrane protease YdiL (CAAX protease family)